MIKANRHLDTRRKIITADEYRERMRKGFPVDKCVTLEEIARKYGLRIGR